MESLGLSREFLVYFFIGQVIFGAVLGLVPLILGRKRKQFRLGIYGFLATIVAGALSPLAAVIVACVFAWLVARKKPDGEEPAASATNGDASVGA